VPHEFRAAFARRSFFYAQKRIETRETMPENDGPLYGPIAEAALLRQILAVLQSIDRKLTPATPKVETRGRTKAQADSNQGS
jgi:hypothetical protein